MKYISKILLITLFACMSAYSAEFYTGRSSVKNLSLGGSGLNGFRVNLEDMQDTGQNCNFNSWYMYEYSDSDPNYDAVYSSLLASKVSGMKVGFQIIGCVTVGSRTYPRISHVYLCDNSQCN